MNNRGKVYIAGAGCGNEGLITVKLKSVMEKAECIIYDRLVNESILQYVKPDAELIYMGKENVEGGELQKKINEIIVEKSREGLTVLRLKGGDPFVFGRGGEEIEALIAENIDFEVIPGISSAIAVPAYAGIPVTHRGINTSFHVFTGHLKKDGIEHDYETVAKLEGTLVFLMGLGNLEKITENLIKHGKMHETPVAVIKNGTTAKQETYTGTLGTIAGIVRENNVKAPVIIIIGEVVNLREKMKWFENMPLFGKNILVTRNRDKQEEITSKIIELGGQAINIPFINIEYLDFEMPDLSKYSTLLFNSLNSVIGFMRKIKDMRVLGHLKIGVVGKKTDEEMKKYRIIPDFYPKDEEKYTELYKRNYDKLVVYNTHKLKIDSEKAKKYVKESDILMFLSSSTFESFADSIHLSENDEMKEMLSKKILASIGPVTTKTIEKYGLKVGVEAKEYTENGLLRAILDKTASEK